MCSNNCQERRTKRDTPPDRRGRRIPGRDVIIRLVGAVPAEQKHEWAEGHRNMGPQILAACRNP
jgi:hypothetical protein